MLIRVLVIAALVTVPIAAIAQSQTPAAPSNAISGIIEAFRTHQIVTLSDWHGNRQVLEFTLSLLRDSRLPFVVNDIVVENGNARYQPVMDRYIQGEDVPYVELRRVWEDTTQAQVLSARDGSVPEMYRTIRQANASLPAARKMRVLLGDPPIDWSKVTTRAEYAKWLEMRDSYPAAVIQTAVLAKDRRALVIYGQMHSQRKNVLANYSAEDPRAHTLVSILMSVTAAPIFTVWTEDDVQRLGPAAASWPVPALLLVRGTNLGSRDFATFAPSPNRFSFSGSQITPLAKDQWRVVPMEQQFDAVLYLGATRPVPVDSNPTLVCSDRDYVQERLRRMSVGAPPPERERLAKLCGSGGN